MKVRGFSFFKPLCDRIAVSFALEVNVIMTRHNV